MISGLENIASFVLLGSGIIFLLIGCIGLIRFPDFFTRLHAAGLIDTLGAGLILIGLVIESGWTLNAVKIIFILLFLFFTSPVSSHVVAKAALTSGLRPWRTEEDNRTSRRKEELP